MQNGDDIVYTLTSPDRMFVVEAIAYGATVTRLRVPDRNGKPADVVLGFADPAKYRGPHPYFGAIACRCGDGLGWAARKREQRE
jgi:aldose 1-epimerase